MEFNLKKILKALLFSTSEWLSIKDIQAVITRYHEENDKVQEQNEDSESGEQGVIDEIIAQVPTLLTATQIREAIDAMSGEFEENREVYKILQGPNGFKLSISPDYADWVRLLRNDPRPQRLTQAALETLAIIAYRQPVTRAEIEAIRGVSADSAIARLSDKELIQITGRADLPGRPLQYGTTSAFLEFIGITSIEELPASDVLSPNQISEWIRRASNPKEIKNEDVGLAAEKDGAEIANLDASSTNKNSELHQENREISE